jgi:hypothetical protein
MAEKEAQATPRYNLEDMVGFRPLMLVPEFTSREFVSKYGQEATRKSIDNIIEPAALYIGVKQRFLDRHLRTIDKDAYIKEYTEAYTEARAGATISELRKHYDDIYKEYFTPEKLAIVDAAIKANADKKYSEIMSEYAKVAEKAINKAGNFTEEEQKKASEELTRLNMIVAPLQDYETERLDALKKPIYKKVKKEYYNSLVPEEKKEGEAEEAKAA